MGFAQELAQFLNQRSREAVSNTPDFILSAYMISCLEAYEEAARARDAWYGIHPSPGNPGPSTREYED